MLKFKKCWWLAVRPNKLDVTRRGGQCQEQEHEGNGSDDESEEHDAATVGPKISSTQRLKFINFEYRDFQGTLYNAGDT
jgi:hypothetical protein